MSAAINHPRFRELDELLRLAVERGDVPGVVGVVADATQKIFTSAWGDADRGTGAAISPLSLLRMASQAKLPTALLVLRLVERGDLDLDTPVAEVLPCFDELLVLDGFDGDSPRFRAPASRATVRQLLTHTSGLAYDFWNTQLDRYAKVTGLPSGQAPRSGVALRDPVGVRL